MRPPSIVMFERLFLASLALSVVSLIINYDLRIEQLAAEPALAELGIGGGLVLGMAAIGYAIYVLLWYFIARKASNVAKWVLVVLLALNLVSLLGALVGPWDLATYIGLAVYALEIAAIAYLFHADAVDWLRGEWNTDPTTFD